MQFVKTALILWVGLLCTFPLSAKVYKMDLSKTEEPIPDTLFHMGTAGDPAIKVNSLYLTLGGKPILPVMGEYHPQRVPQGVDPRPIWKDRLLKMKAAGVNIVSAYIFWLFVEEQKDHFNWEGANNIRAFLQVAKEVNIKVWLRIGPYCNAELRNGGLPNWIVQTPNIKPRTNDPLYLNYVQRWYHQIALQIHGYLYKDNGPILGVQLENEYVTEGLVIPHLSQLKKMARQEGIDVPVYSMTHWMASDYPQGEITPMAGFYIEMPWANSTEKLPPSDYLFFNYNRVANNIGTDIIKKEENLQSLNADEIKSPFFTCEVGLGNQVLYRRRPILDQYSAGANINMRLGSGVVLMGYYMFSGGSNPVGKETSFESSGVNTISYDFMAPIGEDGTLSSMYKEVKKYNYFMNDFGEELAQEISYFPKENSDTSHLQWAVRAHNDRAYLFVSNYLREWNRKDYKGVQFSIQLKGTSVQIPAKHTITIPNKAYFHFPIHQQLGSIEMQYALAQPLMQSCEGDTTNLFFIEKYNIASEYALDNSNIIHISSHGDIDKNKTTTLLSQVSLGLETPIEITTKDSKTVRIFTLTDAQAENLWKINLNNKEYVLYTSQGVKVDNGHVTLYGKDSNMSLKSLPALPQAKGGRESGLFTHYSFKLPEHTESILFKETTPLLYAQWIQSEHGDYRKVIHNNSLSQLQTCNLYLSTQNKAQIELNGEKIRSLTHAGNYIVSIPKAKLQEKNIELCILSQGPIAARIEINHQNSDQHNIYTDNTWYEKGDNVSHPVSWVHVTHQETQWNTSAKYYTIPPMASTIDSIKSCWRLKYRGSTLEIRSNGKLLEDNLWNGLPCKFPKEMYTSYLSQYGAVVKIVPFTSSNPHVFLEESVSKDHLDIPKLEAIDNTYIYQKRL